MEVIGYILSERSVEPLLPGIKVIKSLEERENGLPCLIIGYTKAKSYYNDIDILSFKLGGDMYWSFDKTEKKELYHHCVLGFQKHIYDDFVNNVKYQYINLFSLRYSRLKQMVNVLRKESGGVYYCSGDMLYLVQKGNLGTVFGVSLKMLKYYGVDTKSVFKIIARNKANILRFDCRDIQSITKYISYETYKITALLALWHVASAN